MCQGLRLCLQETEEHGVGVEGLGVCTGLSCSCKGCLGPLGD